MIKRSYILPAIFLLTLLSSCELVGDIFEAGAYVGMFVVIAVLVIIFGLFYYIRR